MKRLVLVDASSYLYRAFFGMRGLATSKGFPTNAIFVFTNMMMKVLKRQKPDYLGMVFDAPGRTFRDDLYADYKATRQSMPEELAKQVPHVKKLPELYRVRSVEVPGVEADDVIGTLARRAAAAGIDTLIVTGDKDLMQLVTKPASQEDRPGISIYDDMKDRRIGIDEVKAKFGVAPEHVVDVLALIGDASDNIPGVTGIGEKTAATLVAAHGGLEAIYASLDKVPERWRKLLEKGRDSAFLSKKLATIRVDVDLPLRPEDLVPGEPDRAALAEFFTTFEFTSLLAEISAGAPKRATIPLDRYRTILTREELAGVVAELSAAERISVDLETTSLDAMRAEIVGISVCVKPGESRYIPVGHRYLGAPAQLPLKEVLDALRPALASKPVIGANLKYDALVFRRAGLELGPPAFDTMLASYLINPDHEHGLKSLSRQWLDHPMTEYVEVAGKGKQQLPFSEVEVEKARDYSGQDVDVAQRHVGPMEERLRQDGLASLMDDIELPILRVLLDMESAGVRIDVEFLRRLSSDFGARQMQALKEVHALAGEEFNPDSPKQLQRILFEKLGLSPGKRTKTGFSTDVSVLEELAGEHELPGRILQYRQLAKLRSTYIDALPGMVHPETGRVHTSYNQAVAATGRLSSTDPNLQNIPIRTPEGRLIRKAFVPEPGRVLVSLDYSQIELRLMAHLSGDPKLVAAFQEDRDIHRATAAEMFGVAPDVVSDEQRSRAKAINFGIIYGMGAFGLSQRLGIDQKQASEFINRYFERYAGVKTYIQKSIEEARKRGYVATLHGRRRYVPELASANRTISAGAERVATNAPLQGTAADLMKVAMIKVSKRLAKEKTGAVMILQVHDELVLEVPEKSKDRAAAAVREEMEGVHPLRVPLKVDVSSGPNWAEME